VDPRASGQEAGSGSKATKPPKLAGQQFIANIRLKINADPEDIYTIGTGDIETEMRSMVQDWNNQEAEMAKENKAKPNPIKILSIDIAEL